MANYLVLIGDIESSRELGEVDRKQLQKNLSGVLEELNNQENGTVSPYTVTLGDEFQAVFQQADRVFMDVMKILARIHPVMARFSLGLGNIHTDINNEEAIGMDGPAFYNARKGIEYLKKEEFLFSIETEEEKPPISTLINGSLQMISAEIRSWNQNRKKISYMLAEGLDYKTIAAELGITEQAVSKNKNEGLLDVIDTISRSLIELLNQKLES